MSAVPEKKFQITKKFERTDPKTGEEIQEEIDAGIAKFKDVMNDLEANKSNIDNDIQNAANKSFGAASKGFSDLGVKTGIKDFDTNSGQVNNFLSNLKANSTDLAKKIRQGLFK